MILDNLNILIVNSNISSRSTLREVLKSHLYKVKINYSQNLYEAKKVIMGEESVDVGFVAFELGQKEITEFIDSLKNESLSSVPPMIATLRTRGDGSTSDITSMYLDGISGFISEPYSSNDILKLLNTIIETKIKLEQKEKLKKASSLLLVEAARQIDTLAETQYNKLENTSKQTLKSLKTISDSLQTLYDQDNDQYAAVLIDAFENIAPPKPREGAAKKKTFEAKLHRHPGTIITELMQQRKLSIESLKGSLKIEPSVFQSLLDGTISIDETSSREISRIFGKTSREWIKMQKDYDAFIEQSKNKRSLE